MDLIQEKVIRHDEQIGAMREELRSGFDRLEAAFKTHAAEDAVAHAKTDELAKAVEIQARVSRRLWGIVTAAAGAGSGIATAAVHFWPK